MKDYESLSIMAEGYGNYFSKSLEGIVAAINNKQIDMLSLTAVKSRIEEVMRALETKARFDSIVSQAKGKLTCNSSGFDLNGHRFETLDEVEKALENKAFL